MSSVRRGIGDNDEKTASVNILGKTYSVEYKDNPAEVDLYKRESVWGQIDFWTRTIRIYDNNVRGGDIAETLIHEILHGIAQELNLELNKAARHEELGLLALGLAGHVWAQRLVANRRRRTIKCHAGAGDIFSEK